MYMVVGVNIKREMVLSPNNEEVANSSKKHTQFKTRVHKPYPISDQNALNMSSFLFLLIRSLQILRSSAYSFAVHCSLLWLMFVLSKSIPYFRPKRLKNHTLWRGTYLYNLYKGLLPQGEKRVADYKSRCLPSETNKSS